MNTTRLILAVPILLAMISQLDGYAVETSDEANKIIGLHEISDRHGACSGACPVNGAIRFSYGMPFEFGPGATCQCRCEKNTWKSGCNMGRK